MSRGRILFVAAISALAGACRTDPATLSDPFADLPARPDARYSGPRLPSFSGTDPVARGWTKVDDLLWVDADEVDAYRRGLVNDGREWVPFDRALPAGTAPERGFLLRTDHVSLRTNLPWRDGVRIARIAETHVRNLAAAWGDALDLRLPAAPLSVVASARRAEFEARLKQVVADPVAWGAFYESRTGSVHVSAEPAPRGALPLEADLRHEMTHQVLDLSTPAAGRSRIFDGLLLWLWEGIAIHAEGLGDPPGAEAGRERLARFRRRLAWNDWTPLERLFALPQREFEGKHYDQSAALMAFLMSDGVPGGRAAVLSTTRRLLRGEAAPGDFERALGVSARDLETRWLAALPR